MIFVSGEEGGDFFLGEEGRDCVFFGSKGRDLLAGQEGRAVLSFSSSFFLVAVLSYLLLSSGNEVREWIAYLEQRG